MMSGAVASSRARTVGSQNTQSPGARRVASGPTARTRPMPPQPTARGSSIGYGRVPPKTSAA